MFKNERKPRSHYPDYFIDSRLEIKKSSKVEGLGVFAKEKIERCELIESSPAILFNKSIIIDWYDEYQTRHILHDYAFTWNLNGVCAVSQGYGGLYNHHNEANIAFDQNEKLQSLEFVTIKSIMPGEELLLRYVSKQKLWFQSNIKK